MKSIIFTALMLFSLVACSQREIEITLNATSYVLEDVTYNQPAKVVITDNLVEIDAPDYSQTYGVFDIYKTKWDGGKGTMYELTSGNSLLVVKGYEWAILYNEDESEVHFNDVYTYDKTVYK